MNSDNKPKFKLGQTVATPGALAALEKSNESALPFLLKHQSGNWGEVCKGDKELNDQAISNEGDECRQQRVLSCYRTAQNERIWIITEWDRSVTTILLPDEY
jgi:hypothetical protein